MWWSGGAHPEAEPLRSFPKKDTVLPDCPLEATRADSRPTTGFERNLRIPVMAGVELRPVHVSHAAASFDLVLRNRERLAEFMGWVRGLTMVEQVEDFARRCDLGRRDGTSLECTLFVDGAVGGNVGLNGISPAHHGASLGYWIASEFAGRGIVTAACAALARHAFGTIGLHRVQIHAMTVNSKSRAVAQRLGFRHEGTLREAEQLGGRYLDLEAYSLLAAEFRPSLRLDDAG